ncbi:hypothetical protein VOLCADRAFT_121751 [Volvox carteri f. nagariensis]|uniref:Uncharacterized protein n=1 Tax=Volvox carteri f. nagariensis TaxID=3068 RepID=D8UJB0_VOLCA|nr:uncharacterized protein VOLCADRAFT_121751 [Volvox carteri f. nagariensis]EFJ40190.1 hypothetical protein VOLCADRAFT_121751 [Volvox carteri f. nagariensis]|eukprot:XP_002958734.1 hypothetical protein VOLCADRAFT_121751 [Volvox carteri f. nagariensis]
MLYGDSLKRILRRKETCTRRIGFIFPKENVYTSSQDGGKPGKREQMHGSLPYTPSSWIGHFGPGIIMIIWGLHWMQGTFRNYFSSQRNKGQDYQARTTYNLWRFPAVSESMCKTFLPMIAMSIELYFAHRGGWRTLVCPAGTKREGRFYGPHMGNWQHAAMYPPVILSGLVDLVGMEVELPRGTQQVFLFLAFLCESLLMGLHKKHTPLDIAVHSVLFYTMMATAVMVLLEAIHPRSFLLSCGRVVTMLVQGGWFVMAAHILFEGVPAWIEDGGEDMAPAMMAPVYFVAIIVVSLFLVFLAYLAFHTYYKYMDSSIACYERAGLLDEDRIDGRPTPHAVPMATLSGNSGTSCHV